MNLVNPLNHARSRREMVHGPGYEMRTNQNYQKSCYADIQNRKKMAEKFILGNGAS